MYGIEQPSSQRRGLWVIIGTLIIMAILAALFFAFYSLVIKKDDDSSTPDVTVITTPTDVAEVTDTAPPSPTDTATTDTATSEPTSPTTAIVAPSAIPPTDTPLPSPTLRPPPEAITIGVKVRVDIGEGLALNLRDEPTLNGNLITQLAHGVEVPVIDGPEKVGDLRWWNVDGGEGNVGWVVDALGGEIWLLPAGWADQPPAVEPTIESPLAPPTAAPVVTPTATATPTLSPTLPPEITPTDTPVLTPTDTPQGGIPSPTIGGRAQVSTQYQFINLRDAAGLGTETIGQLANGTTVTILEGPEEMDGLRWWKVDDGQGNVGWAAERIGAEVLLVPIL